MQKLYLKNISIGINMQVESATMMRVLSLPTSFFKDYSSGDLALRVDYMNVLVSQLVEMGLSGIVTFLYSFVYIFQLFSFSPALAWPGLCVTVLVLLVNIVSTHEKAKIRRAQMELEAKESGLSVAMFSGVEKIRLSDL